jgi:2-haloacid dehalogenase
MAAQKPIVIAFDAYGTLLSTASISNQLTTYYGEEKAKLIAGQWRRYQLEYTWRLNSMGNLFVLRTPTCIKTDNVAKPDSYLPFSTVTKSALSNAVRETGEQLTTLQSSALMTAYDSLSVFPDVPAALELLGNVVKSGSVCPVIFSNGTRDMVHVSLSESPDFSASYSLFKDVVLIDEMPEKARRYKPARETYVYLAETVERRLDDVWLITSNPFDIVGARAARLKTAFVGRDGGGWVDGLGLGLELGPPDIVVTGVDAAVTEILAKEGIA